MRVRIKIVKCIECLPHSKCNLKHPMKLVIYLPIFQRGNSGKKWLNHCPRTQVDNEIID